jgi:hypothetical protein
LEPVLTTRPVFVNEGQQIREEKDTSEPGEHNLFKNNQVFSPDLPTFVAQI